MRILHLVRRGAGDQTGKTEKGEIGTALWKHLHRHHPAESKKVIDIRNSVSATKMQRLENSAVEKEV